MKTTQEALLIRVEGGPKIGVGHIMRCLALAQAWQEVGGQTHFALANAAPALVARLLDGGMAIHYLPAGLVGGLIDANQTAILAQEVEARWVVVDGYDFGAAYQRAIKEAGLRLLFVDDYGHCDHYYADLVLNQNAYANEALYLARELHTHLLLGTRYALLRREFWPWQGWQREIPEVARKILVTLGGGDSNNMTLKVIHALQQLTVEGVEAMVVVGGSNPHLATLSAVTEQWTETRPGRSSIHLMHNVANLPELMAWADIAVSAGGTTCWELAFMGSPNLALVLADNQRPVVESLDALGVAVNLGWHEEVTATGIAHTLHQLLVAPGRRVAMNQRGQTLVDGRGGCRVAAHLKPEPFRLRLTRAEDCHLLWEWANDPMVRAASFSSEPIPWDRHVQWFKSRLADPNCLLFVATTNDGAPIGQLRYDLKQAEAVISISLDARFRHQGYGSQLIVAASQRVFDLSNTKVIYAYIKADNGASQRAFEKAGFSHAESVTVGKHQAHRLRLEKGDLP